MSHDGVTTIFERLTDPWTRSATSTKSPDGESKGGTGRGSFPENEDLYGDFFRIEWAAGRVSKMKILCDYFQ